MRATIGSRVGAVLSSGPDEVRLLGYGVYEGLELPPFGPFGMSLEQFKASLEEQGLDLEQSPWRNPKIVLDDGRVVWGCQCWWGPEEKIKASIGPRRVVMVDLNDQELPEQSGMAVSHTSLEAHLDPAQELDLQALAEYLTALQSQENKGHGVSCVQQIAFYLSHGKLDEAKAIMETEWDKIASYPAIAQHFKDVGMVSPNAYITRIEKPTAQSGAPRHSLKP